MNNIDLSKVSTEDLRSELLWRSYCNSAQENESITIAKLMAERMNNSGKLLVLTDGKFYKHDDGYSYVCRLKEVSIEEWSEYNNG